mmetsp:Transcript_36924/g.95753  ORF Transcript_36924/g.95753 Transcript_36924/m.95753 type:complete len:223 (+) Transcript_36924:325-993(+)
MEAASCTKYSMSFSPPSAHLLASCASRTCSLAKQSSRSKSSSAGGGGSRIAGGKMAGCSGGSGVSNCGDISVSGALFTCSCEYRPTASGTASVCSLKRPSSKSAAQSRGGSSPSCKHARRRSASASVSGRGCMSMMSGSSASMGFSATGELGLRNLKTKSISLEFSSLSSHLSSNTCAEPITTSLPAPRLAHTAASGRCMGYAILPVARSGMAGFCTVSVAP